MGHNDPVLPNVISTILLVLAVVLVVLTRLRLAKDDEPGAGRLDIPLTPRQRPHGRSVALAIVVVRDLPLLRA